MRKAVVISNCQCLPLASALNRMALDVHYDFWGVHVLPPTERTQAIADFIVSCKRTYDVILSIPLSEDFDDLSSSKIRSTFKNQNLFLISNIYFSGFHPDLTYIGGLGKRVVGVVGDYHSKIALYCFLSGLKLEYAKNLYCSEAYSAANFYDEYASSLNELERRDAGVDIPVHGTLKTMLASQLCFLTVNHPTIEVFAAYAQCITDFLAEKQLVTSSQLPLSTGYFNESLAQNIVFPIYKEIAEYHKVPQLGSYTFKPDGTNANCVGLDVFLHEEYKAFAQIGSAELSRSAAADLVKKQFASVQLPVNR